MTEEKITQGQELLSIKKRYQSVLETLANGKFEHPDPSLVIEFFGYRNLLFNLGSELSKVCLDAIAHHCKERYIRVEKEFEEL